MRHSEKYLDDLIADEMIGVMAQIRRYTDKCAEIDRQNLTDTLFSLAYEGNWAATVTLARAFIRKDGNWMALDDDDTTTAAMLLRPIADDGCIEAYPLLGEITHDVKWLKLALSEDPDDPDNLYNLHKWYYYLPDNSHREMALHYLTLASNQGHPVAMHKLAEIYIGADDYYCFVPTDESRAKGIQMLYDVYKHHGHLFAMFTMIDCYVGKYGCDKDIDKAKPLVREMLSDDCSLLKLKVYNAPRYIQLIQADTSYLANRAERLLAIGATCHHTLTAACIYGAARMHDKETETIRAAIQDGASLKDFEIGEIMYVRRFPEFRHYVETD